MIDDEHTHVIIIIIVISIFLIKIMIQILIKLCDMWILGISCEQDSCENQFKLSKN